MPVTEEVKANLVEFMDGGWKRQDFLKNES